MWRCLQLEPSHLALLGSLRGAGRAPSARSTESLLIEVFIGVGGEPRAVAAMVVRLVLGDVGGLDPVAQGQASTRFGGRDAGLEAGFGAAHALDLFEDEPQFLSFLSLEGVGVLAGFSYIDLEDRIPAKQAQEWGLIWTAVPDAELDAEVARVAERLKHTSPSAVTRTRAIVDAILADELDAAGTDVDPFFGIAVPRSCPRVPAPVLQPRSTWQDPVAYDEKARHLVQLFTEHFRGYEDEATDIATAGPRA